MRPAQTTDRVQNTNGRARPAVFPPLAGGPDQEVTMKTQQRDDASEQARRGAPGLAALVLCALAPGLRASTGEGETDTEDLKNLSIEELMELEVTIATRSEQSLSDVPGAVYVLTGDEIRRAGHSSIPEALRMVPGFYVSHWFSQAWDVTARGFGPGLSLTSSAFLNQLIVMIDGVVV